MKKVKFSQAGYRTSEETRRFKGAGRAFTCSVLISPYFISTTHIHTPYDIASAIWHLLTNDQLVLFGIMLILSGWIFIYPIIVALGVAILGGIYSATIEQTSNLKAALILSALLCAFSVIFGLSFAAILSVTISTLIIFNYGTIDQKA